MTNTASPFIQLLASWDAWAVTGLLVLGLPSFAYFGLYKGARSQNYFGRLSKVGTHLWISGALWFALLALTVVAARHDLSLADMGVNGLNPMRQIATTIVVLALLSAMTLLDFRKHQRMTPDALGKKLATAA